MSFRIEILTNQPRKTFDCGDARLNSYFREQAGQDIRRRASLCYLAIDVESGEVGGFYTISAAEVETNLVPSAAFPKLPRYRSVPVARVGRLAVDLKWRGHGLGHALIVDAAVRASQSGIGIMGLIVDAKDDNVAGFYERLGFVRINQTGLTLMSSISRLMPPQAS